LLRDWSVGGIVPSLQALQLSAASWLLGQASDAGTTLSLTKLDGR
jgi:hypothetical protein